jgi:hypothetical protein
MPPRLLVSPFSPFCFRFDRSCFAALLLDEGYDIPHEFV